MSDKNTSTPVASASDLAVAPPPRSRSRNASGSSASIEPENPGDIVKRRSRSGASKPLTPAANLNLSPPETAPAAKKVTSRIRRPAAQPELLPEIAAAPKPVKRPHVPRPKNRRTALPAPSSDQAPLAPQLKFEAEPAPAARSVELPAREPAYGLKKTESSLPQSDAPVGNGEIQAERQPAPNFPSREPRRDFQNRADRQERHDRPPRVDFNDRGERPPVQERGDRAERQDRPPQQERPFRPEQRNQPQQERQERRPRFEQQGGGGGGRNERFNRGRRPEQQRERGEPRPDQRGEPHPDRQPFSREPRDPRPEPLPLSPPEPGEGLFELAQRGGYGYVRQKSYQFAINTSDPYVSPEMIRKYQLRDGQWLNIQQRKNHRGYQAVEVTQINGEDPEKYQNLPAFEELKAVNPTKRFALETAADRLTTRMIDLLTPIGRGQRGLIVAPPRTGKTTFLRHIAEAIQTNYSDSVHLMVLLVDERPEEVTEFQRSLPGVEIWASSNDNDVKSHIRMAELAITRAKRLVEAGKHVFMLMDSITRLARAFNNSGKGSGRTMKGGVDIGALEIPRRLFAAARNTRTAGSLTIIATALIETNSAADELIYQEFKGTGNMELVLDRRMAEQYVFPAIDIFRSGSRREELLLPGHMLEKIHIIRRGLSGHKPLEAIERLNQIMGKFPNNPQMLMEIKASKA